MSNETIIFLVVAGLILIGVAFIIYKFVVSILARRAYEKEELPDINEVEVEDVVLPDIEESGFSRISDEYEDEEDPNSDIYREISEAKSDRRSR